MKKNKKKVAVAMSGGVDSSVTAAILKKSGFDVIGVFMRLVDLPNFKKNQRQARKIAQILNIPFLVLDLRKEFKKKIIDYFLKEYKKGNTPNPCVVCNKEIKFGLFLKKTLRLGVDFIATGHYVRKIQNYNSKFKFFKLLKAKDTEKDQSYFLWQLNQKQLRHSLFPLGNYTKNQVKKMAQKWRLPVLKKESQEICFIDKSVDDFLFRHLGEKKGKIIYFKKPACQSILGEHKGLWFYTIGQRKGIKISGGPFYVVAKNFQKNYLIVTSFLNDKSLFSKKLIAKNVNWISGKTPNFPLKVKAKIRYNHKPVLAIVKKLKIKSKKFNFYEVVFNHSQRAVTPGQSVVFYKNQELLGGGIIHSVF